MFVNCEIEKSHPVYDKYENYYDKWATPDSDL
jgi:hypothetical protein